MRAGEAADGSRPRARGGCRRPTIRALAALAVLAAALLVVTGTVGSARPGRPAANGGRRVEVLGEQVTRPATAAPRTTTPSASAPPRAADHDHDDCPAAPGAGRRVGAAPVAPAAVSTSCADALAYLAAHQAPGFTDRVCRRDGVRPPRRHLREPAGHVRGRSGSSTSRAPRRSST